jgi:hypothetical protein
MTTAAIAKEMLNLFAQDDIEWTRFGSGWKNIRFKDGIYQYCVLTAACSSRLTSFFTSEQVREFLNTFKHKAHCETIIDWNDDPSRVWADVEKILNEIVGEQ